MSRSPYKDRPRLHVDTTKHELGDVVTVGNVRWAIRSIRDDHVTLEALNSSAGASVWHTTLNRLPAPQKEHRS